MKFNMDTAGKTAITLFIIVLIGTAVERFGVLDVTRLSVEATWRRDMLATQKLVLQTAWSL